MRTRYFRVVSTGEWLDATLTSEDEFSVPADSHEESLSQSVGEPVEVVEVEGATRGSASSASSPRRRLS